MVPSPEGKTPHQYMQEVYSYLLDLEQRLENTGTQLTTLPSSDLSAVQPGVLMWNPVSGRVTVSDGTAWADLAYA